MNHLDRDTYRLSTGRVVRSTVGLSKAPDGAWAVAHGRDGEINGACDPPSNKAWTWEEKVELAEYMIGLWATFGLQVLQGAEARVRPRSSVANADFMAQLHQAVEDERRATSLAERVRERAAGAEYVLRQLSTVKPFRKVLSVLLPALNSSYAVLQVDGVTVYPPPPPEPGAEPGPP